MICNNCGFPNPNGYTGICRSCRQPLAEEVAEVVVEKEKKKPVLKKKPKKAESENSYRGY
tara:strand:+ start:1959 stop:2138 length:180 start_codon:yes stop_codon:yes gene_type:complete